MKRIYLFLVAALCSLASFAVEYDSPITVWSGACDYAYGYYPAVLIPQTTYDWSTVVENSRITIYFKASQSAAGYAYLSACEQSSDYDGGDCFYLNNDGDSYEILAGESSLKVVLNGDDAAALQLIPSLYVWAFSDGDIIRVTLEYPKGQTPTGIGEVRMADIYAQNKTIVAPAEARIFNITGQEVTQNNGSLVKGLYVVRVGKQTTKVIVK